jgi:hypothetical protein
MNCPIAEPQKPWLIRLLSTIPNILHRPVCVVVGRVPIDLPRHPVEFQNLIVIVIAGVLRPPRPIPDNLLIPVSTKPRVTSRVPLADPGGVITGLTQLSSEC